MAASEIALIIGANMAGAVAAETLRREGFDGQIVLVGAEPDAPYERPPLSKAWLSGATTTAKITLRTAQFYTEQHIDLRLGRRAVALDSARRLVSFADGTVHGYDRLLIATGTVPRTVKTADGAEIPSAALPGIMYLRTLADAQVIRDALVPGCRLVVIGAGFIGAEVAAVARGLGLHVTMLEVLPVPLRRALGDAIGQVYADLHRAHGVDLRLNTGVVGFTGADRVTGVIATDGSTIPADLVVIGVGVRPATDWLAGSGLDLANGVLIDEHCATNVPGIYAAGDVANWYHPILAERLRVEHYDNAVKQGAAAALAMLGKGEAYAPVPYFWSDQYALHLQYLGHALSWDEVVLRGDLAGFDGMAWYLRAGIPRAALLFNRQRELLAARRLLAAAQPVDRAHLADPARDLRSLIG